MFLLCEVTKLARTDRWTTERDHRECLIAWESERLAVSHKIRIHEHWLRYRRLAQVYQTPISRTPLSWPWAKFESCYWISTQKNQQSQDWIQRNFRDKILVCSSQDARRVLLVCTLHSHFYQKRISESNSIWECPKRFTNVTQQLKNDLLKILPKFTNHVPFAL